MVFLGQSEMADNVFLKDANFLEQEEDFKKKYVWLIKEKEKLRFLEQSHTESIIQFHKDVSAIFVIFEPTYL